MTEILTGDEGFDPDDDGTRDELPSEAIDYDDVEPDERPADQRGGEDDPDNTANEA